MFRQEPPTGEHRAVAIGLGSNQEPRIEHLAMGAAALRPWLEGIVFSSVYETAPELVLEQPRFLNACCIGWTDLEPHDLLARLKAVERRAGRCPGPRYGPRELDLDILLYGDEVIATEHLRVPHARLLERAFVLIPLAEVAGGWLHPEWDRTISSLAADVDASGVEATNLQILPEGGAADER